MGKLIRRKKVLRFILLLTVIIPVTIFVFSTDFNAVLKELMRIGYGFFYLIFLSFAAYLLATWGWYVCLGIEKKRIGLFYLFVVRQIGETVGVFNPTSVVGGDLVKINMLKSQTITTQTAENSVIVTRITAILSQILLFIIGVAWLSTSITLAHPADTILHVVVVVLIGIKIGLFIWLFTPIRKEFPQIQKSTTAHKILYKLRKLLYEVKYFTQRSPRIFWFSYFLFAVHWIVGSTEFVLILSYLEIPISLLQGLLMDMSIVVIKSLGAVVPGQIGVEELGNKLLLGIIGIHTTVIWITVSILRRSRQLFWIGVGFLLYMLLKNKRKQIAIY